MLGAALSEESTKEFLGLIGLDPGIKIPRGEIAEVVESPEHGLELTFKLERAIKTPPKDYKEGDLVLANIRMYARPVGGFDAYKGDFPLGIASDMTIEG